jgi:hypothetical protein
MNISSGKPHSPSRGVNDGFIGESVAQATFVTTVVSFPPEKMRTNPRTSSQRLVSALSWELAGGGAC